MPLFKPLKGIVASEQFSSHFPIQGIENYTKEELEKRIQSSVYTLFSILAPTLVDSDKTNTEKYKEVRNNFDQAIEQEILEKSRTASLYIYEQTHQNGENFKGILGLCALEDYKNNLIKKHENTLTPRVNIFTEYLSETHIQSEPVLLTYTESTKIEVLIDREIINKPFIKYEDDLGVMHKLWKIDNRLKLSNYVDAFKNLKALYIADGHHRLESTYEYSKQETAKDKNAIGNEPYNFVLSLAVQSNELKILEYNRLLKDIGNLSKNDFLEKISKNFSIVEKGDKPYFPTHKHHISMYMEGEFFSLHINHELRGVPEGLGELDTYLFEELLLKPILNIQDTQKDPRISFLKGSGDLNGILELKKHVDSGKYKVGFGFNPLNYSDLQLIADLGLTMPPKSTFIAPKLQSGLVIYDMKS